MKKRQKKIISKIRLAFGGVIVFVVSAVVAGAAGQWVGPLSPPTDVSSLDPIVDLSDYVSKIKLSEQRMKGPLGVLNNNSYAARLGLNTAKNIYEFNVDDETGEHNSIAIDPDGLAVISMYNDNVNSVQFMRCANELCTTNSANGHFDRNTGDEVGKYTGIAIGSDGFPIFSYHWEDGSIGQVRVIHCTSRDCSTADAPAVIDQSLTDDTLGVYTAIAIAQDGNPVITYYAGGDLERQRIRHCKNVSCTSLDTVLTLPTPNVNGYASIAVMNTGRPAVTYDDGGNRWYAYCNDAICSSAAAPVEIDGNAAHGARLVVGGDGMPVVAYIGNLGSCGGQDCGEPWILRCNAVTCATGNVKKQISLTDKAQDMSVAIAYDGNPVVAYYIPDNAANRAVLKVVLCAFSAGSWSCGTPATVDTINDNPVGDPSVAEDVSIVIGNDGFPLIAYHDQPSSSLKILHCENLACTWTNPAQVGALGLGFSTGFHGFLPTIAQGSTIGALGYAQSGSINYGIYAASDGGVGLEGRAEAASHFAGLFYGPVEVNDPETGVLGSLNITDSTDGTLTAESGLYSLKTINIGMTTPGSATRGIAATTAGAAATNGAGIYGASTLAGINGISAAAFDEISASYGESSGVAATSYGVYGYATDGNGVTGEDISGQTDATGVYGQGVDYGVYGFSNFTFSGTECAWSGGACTGGATYSSEPAGVGVLACGTEWAAEFTNDLLVRGGLTMGEQSRVYVESGGSIVGIDVTPEVSLTEQELLNIAADAGVTLGP